MLLNQNLIENVLPGNFMSPGNIIILN